MRAYHLKNIFWILVFSVLQRITWLNKKGVAFTFNFEQKKKDLKNICPEWESTVRKYNSRAQSLCSD
jgi:hypothetical protein